MLVGEQPGDQEDLAGHPFVGPAGKVLDRAMAEAGLDRKKVWLTNAVKHFKNEPRGKKRLHKRPNRYEVEVCRVWLRQEISLVKPQLILALGVTAAVALAGRPVVLSRERGKVIELEDGQRGMVTTHPSSILRMPDQKARTCRLCGPGERPQSGCRSRRRPERDRCNAQRTGQNLAPGDKTQETADERYRRQTRYHRQAEDRAAAPLQGDPDQRRLHAARIRDWRADDGVPHERGSGLSPS